MARLRYWSIFMYFSFTCMGIQRVLCSSFSQLILKTCFHTVKLVFFPPCFHCAQEPNSWLPLHLYPESGRHSISRGCLVLCYGDAYLDCKQSFVFFKFSFHRSSISTMIGTQA